MTYAALRTDKSVIIESAYERFVVYFDGISSLGNVVDKDGTGSEHIPKFTKLKSLLALAATEPTKLFSERADSLPRLHLEIPFEDLQKLRSDRVQSIKEDTCLIPNG